MRVFFAVPEPPIRETLKQGWESFRVTCLNADSSPAQIIDMRRAFYSGARWLMWAQMRGLDADREPTEADMRYIASIQTELDQFLIDMDTGRA